MNDIKEIFNNYAPQLSDSKEFMNRLEERLDSAETVKKVYEDSRRNYWTGSLVTFGIGAAFGAFVLFVVLLRPSSLTQLRLFFEGVILRFFAFWREILFIGVIISLILVIIPIIRSRNHSLQNIN